VGITINLVEKRSGTVSAGFGYSNRAQLIGFAEVSESNFQGRAEAVNLRGEIGGTAGRASIETGFTEPHLDRHRTALNVQLYDKTVYRFSNSLTNSIATQSTSGSSRYNEQRIGGTVTVSRPFLRTYRAALSLRGEQVQTDPLDLSVNNASIIQDGPIFVLGAQLIHNTRDIDIDPVTGGFQTLNLQTGHANLSSPKTFTGITIPGITGSVNFSKVLFDARQYISLSGPRRRDKPDEEKTTFATRVQLGSSVGTLPFFEQFFVGGGDNLRGYKDDRFWGSNQFLASGELRQPIARSLKGVLFLDVGDAWGGDYNNVQIQGFTQDGFHPHVGVGLGMRVKTPIGPLRLDYGFGDEGGRFHFSIGPTF
jgi:outer membrane protein insertion porin family